LIKSFKSRALADLWARGRAKGIQAQMRARVLRRLDALNNAKAPRDMDLPGFRFHALKGHAPLRYSVWVNGPWRVTFEFEGEDAYRVDLEQYH
jgi:toxin HigB-1